MGRFSRAVAAGLLDEAWRLLSGAAGAYLELRLGKPLSGARTNGAVVAQRTAFRGRAGRDGAAASRRVAGLLLRVRQLERVCDLWPTGPGVLPREAELCLAAAVRGAADLGGA